MLRRSEPFISIITPSFNSVMFIETTIKSVINQSYKNFEYIIIDGGSNDGTLEIIKKYKKRLSYWVSEPDRGMYHAINKGLSKAKGSIVAYLNSDDIYYSDTLRRVADFFCENTKISLVYGKLDFIDKNNKWLFTLNYPKFCSFFFMRANFSTIGQPASFWKADVSKSNNGFDLDLKLAADYDFFIRIGRSYEVCFLPEVLAAFRIHNHQLTKKYAKTAQNEIKIIHKRYLPKELKIKKILVSFFYHLYFKLLNINANLRKIKIYLIYVANKKFI